MLISAVISPHPPIIIPEVGGEETRRVKKTISALKKLNQKFKKLKPETIIIVTPHGLIYPDSFNVCAMPFLRGSLAHFGAQMEKTYQNDLELVYALNQEAQKADIPIVPYDNGKEAYEIDHGVLVPLYYLAEGLKVKVVPITYSYLSVPKHFSFGQLLGEVVGKTEKKVAFVASGDLSHRLKYSQYGYVREGKIFDKKIIEFLKKGNTKGILSLDENLIESAGECGYRSIAIMLGLLDQRKWQGKILSYEAPFGIGYLVADIEFS
ncbi:AmmeMemoRadiSam system protein B [bacterium]|nr:AmmeMemoRadiSam system protein B [bacterium]